MLRISKIEDVLKNKLDFLEDMYQSIDNMYNDSKSKELFKYDSNYDMQIIKAYRSENNDVIYIIEKTNFGYRLYANEIQDYEKDKSIKEILYWDNLPITKKKKEIYSIKVIAIPNNPKESFSIVSEKYITELYERVKELAEKEVQSENNVEVANQEKKELANKILMIGGVTGFYSVTNNIEQIKSFMDYTKKIYDDKFYIDLLSQDCENNNKSLFDHQIKIKNLIKVCKDNNYTSYDSAYEFNDLDNLVWIDNNNLVISDQNIYFYIKYNDEKNYTIYMGFKDIIDFDEFKNNIETNNVSIFKDVFLEVIDNKTTYINQCYNECYTLDLDFSVEAMEEDQLIEINYPEDIYSYKYQKNYVMNKYNYSEFEFIVQAMMTLGGGFDYDENTGNFFTKSVKYEEDLPEAENDRHKKVKDMTYLYPKSFNYLNNDWRDALEYAVEVLKRDRPIPVAYKGDNPDDALDKAIKYFELKLNKLKNKPGVK